MITVNDLLELVEDIRSVLLEEAPKCEKERRVTPRAFQALRDAGMFTLHAPKRFGGLEMHPIGCMRIWEAIGRIDSSIAWNAFMTHAGYHHSRHGCRRTACARCTPTVFRQWRACSLHR